MVEFKRESRFLVLKQDDIDRYLDSYLKSHLESITAMIREGREEEGRKDNSYVVVNEDEPYAEQVWKLVQDHWEEEEQRRKALELYEKTRDEPRGSFFNP